MAHPVASGHYNPHQDCDFLHRPGPADAQRAADGGGDRGRLHRGDRHLTPDTRRQTVVSKMQFAVLNGTV